MALIHRLGLVPLQLEFDCFQTDSYLAFYRRTSLEFKSWYCLIKQCNENEI